MTLGGPHLPVVELQFVARGNRKPSPQQFFANLRIRQQRAKRADCRTLQSRRWHDEVVLLFLNGMNPSPY